MGKGTHRHQTEMEIDGSVKAFFDWIILAMCDWPLWAIFLWPAHKMKQINLICLLATIAFGEQPNIHS